MDRRNGFYARASAALSERRDEFSPVILARMFGISRNRADSCICYLMRKRLIERLSRGSYRYHSAA